MSSAFRKDVRRSITGSLGRFLAILGIVALGCGFYAGLRMTGADMRIGADNYYDKTDLYDIRLLSTLGFSDDITSRIAGIDGVEGVMAECSTDVMATLNGEQYAIRVSSMDIAAAEGSDTGDGRYAYSSDVNYLNRLVLSKGDWPREPGQCVLSADRVMGTPIQIGDTVQVLYGSKDLDGVLDVRTYTVTGLVHSSTYVSSVSLGSTTLGSGVIQQYMYVSDGSFASDCPYTEAFVKVAGSDAEFAGGDAYQRKVDAVSERISAQVPDIAAGRLADVKADAQKRVDEGRDEYDSQKATADSELASGKEKLDEALSTLNSTQDELDDGAAQIADGQAQIDDARASWQSGYEQWQSASAQWAAKRTGLAQQQAALQTQLSSAESDRATLVTQQAAIEKQMAGLDPSSAAYKQLAQQLAAVKAGITQADAGIAKLQAGIAQYEAGIQQGDAEVAAAKAELDSAHDVIDDNQATLDAKQAELDDGYAQLEEGWSEYRSSLATYESSRSEALTKLADAAEVIANAQHDVDAIAAPDIYVLDRTKNLGVSSFKADSERIDNIAAVFPFIFFLVAALVALTTMTRMVEEERVTIGTYKALGYGTGRIASKYLVYAGIASVVGAVVGILVLSQVLPFTICKAYAIIYNVPQMDIPLYIDPALSLLAAGMGVGITLFATWAAVVTTLREQPAALMLPRAPKAGKRILLERITPLWRRFSFSWKVTCRNLFRYRKRLWMTVIGIAGCTALLLTGLGLHDAIWDIIDNQFGDIMHYNVIVGLDDGVSESDVARIEQTMVEVGDMTNRARVQEENMQLGSSTHDPMGMQVTVPRDVADMTSLITMRDRTTHRTIAFDDDSVVLTEKLAHKLGVGAGDTVTLYDQDEIGNATGSGYTFTVTDVMENYLGNRAFIGKEVYTSMTGMDPGYTSLFALCTDDADKRVGFSQQLHDTAEVETVAFNDETIDSYRKMLRSVNMIVVVLVTAAAALAFIVLYNLTNINITERRREIASLKVLGFSPREVDGYIFREISLLTIIGALFGLVLGIFMESFVVVTAEVDMVMFGRVIHASSFLLAFALTLVFSAFVMVTMRGKLAAIDMVESLKSIE